MDSLQKWIAESARNGTRAEGLRGSGMSLLGVSEEEFAIITDACVEATTKLRNNHEEAVRYIDAERGAGRLPSKEERAAFEGKRTGILAGC